MVSQKELLFLDETGEIAARSAVPQDSWLGACRDSSGRAYLYDSMSGTLYTIDWANHALGQQLFETEDYAQILPGGGDYDFLLVNETKLSGASLTTGTVTEMLRWTDYDLTATVGMVEYVDEDTFLISVSSMMGVYGDSLSATGTCIGGAGKGNGLPGVSSGRGRGGAGSQLDGSGGLHPHRPSQPL